MPRKKTIQPEPLKTFELEDGTIVEIRDHETREIGRGLDKQWKAENLVDGILEQLVNMIQGPDAGQTKKAIEVLESPKGVPVFIRLLQMWGYEESDRTLRKYATACRAKWLTLCNACREAGKDPYQKL
tara:strand:- start:203 stop:586 length:384 start_codon:yes stop_codon:yes gene_type:complete